MRDFMTIAHDSIKAFLEQFQTNSNSKDATAQVSHFSEVFLAAGPGGAAPVTVEDFAKVLPKRRQILEQAGLQGANLGSFETTATSERHAVVNVVWNMCFTTQAEAHITIPVSATFVLDMAGEKPHLLVYLAHQDIMKVLKDKGMLRSVRDAN
jgi:hypothetical protein